jgi:hypothetical protein
MFIITREKIEALKQRLLDPAAAGRCRQELQKVLEIKQALLWRADAGTCCAGPRLPSRLFAEVQLLEAALQALEAGDNHKAASLLEDFASQAQYA